MLLHVVASTLKIDGPADLASRLQPIRRRFDNMQDVAALLVLLHVGDPYTLSVRFEKANIEVLAAAGGIESWAVQAYKHAILSRFHTGNGRVELKQRRVVVVEALGQTDCSQVGRIGIGLWIEDTSTRWQAGDVTLFV